MLMSFADLSPAATYHLMIQTIIPRPVAWVLTENSLPDATGPSYNLAPFSYFTAVSSTPPLLMFSVGRKADDSPKDTLANAKSTGQFVIHIASSESAEAVTSSAASLPYGQSELDKIDSTTTSFGDFPLPRVSEAPVAFGCRLFDATELGGSKQTLVFGEILHAYIDDSVITDAGEQVTVSADKVDPLARLGGADYAALGQPFTVERSS